MPAQMIGDFAAVLRRDSSATAKLRCTSSPRMTADQLLAFCAFAAITSITPGPNNIMMLASGVNHGFVFPQRVGAYQQAASERHWERLFSLFGRTLA